MKKLFMLSAIFTLLLTAEYGFAQMGGGMMGGQGSQKEGMGGGMQHDHKKMMDHKGMMSGDKMMGSMMDMSSEMSDMMSQMSDMMDGMTMADMQHMSGLMSDMGRQMTDMSMMMKKGIATDREMEAMHQKMMEMQKRMSEMHGKSEAGKSAPGKSELHKH